MGLFSRRRDDATTDSDESVLGRDLGDDALDEAAASSEHSAQALREVLRGIVVVRDGQARPPREILPLHAPGAAAGPEAEDLPGIDPLAPGPTIAEVR